MATKKAAEVKAEEVETKPVEVVPEKADAEVPAVKDEWDEYVEMLIPRRPKGDDQQFYICVNDRRFYIPANGKTQKLPKPIAEILKQSLEAENEAEDFAESIPNKTGPSQDI